MTVLYNVTIKLDHSIAGDWRQWMLKEHIPMLMETKCFMEAKLFRLLDVDDTDGPTFCAQYFCATRENYDDYIENFADKMRAESQKMWGGKFVAFRSLMQLQS